MAQLNFSILLAHLLGSLVLINAQWDPNFAPGRSVIVHLFEWRWNDIADECERFLGPQGYGGVQVSPVHENRLELEPNFRPWSERYTPVNFQVLTTRSGTEEEFASMVRRCNAAGVRIYVDAIMNHLTGEGVGDGVGTGGSPFNAQRRQFPHFSSADFNDDKCPTQSGNIEDWSDPVHFRNCRLDTLLDLNQEKDYVREQLVNFLNRLIGHGVAGFRIDAAKHMWPESLQAIFGRLNNLSTAHGFREGTKPCIYQEVSDMGTPDQTIGHEYFHMGRVTEFRTCLYLGETFRGNNQLKSLQNWGTGWGLYDDDKALTFVDNHDNQRGHGGGPMVLTFRDSRLYKMAIAFLLAHPYGLTRIMSSYYWEQRWEGGRDVNDWVIKLNLVESNTKTCWTLIF